MPESIIHTVMDDIAERHPMMRALKASRSGLLVLAGCLFLAGCDTIASDFQDLADQFSPPTGEEAGRWATDFSDPENQQRGLTLIGNAPWGGEPEYLQLYRTCIEGPFDPLVKSAAIRALAYHGDPTDALLIASQLDHEVAYVRLEAAKGLQRLHDPEVADTMWQHLVNEEEQSIRIELAIALGQYPKDAVFQALVLALESRELAVNLAAADSLRTMTGQNHGLNARDWLAWYDSTKDPFQRYEIYLYPVYTRPLGFLDRINIFNPIKWQKPGVPRGMDETGSRSTWADGPAETQEGS